MALRNVKEHLSKCVAQAQRDKILITKHGDPAAILWGVEGKDLEDLFYMLSANFWKMIQKRRTAPPIPWKKAKKQLR